MGWDNLGINFGGDYNGGQERDDAEIAADLTFLKNHMPKIRVALAANASAAGIANSKAIALEAKEQGFYTVWGVCAGGNIDNTAYDNWKAAVDDNAQWAQDNAMDEFTIGNEEGWQANLEQLGTQTVANVIADVKSLATTCQSIFTRGPINYCDSQGVRANWIAAGLGDIDRIGFNVYDNIDNFTAIVPQLQDSFGSKFFLSEWAAQHYYTQLGKTNAQYAQEIADRLMLIKQVGVSAAYFFSWRNDYTWNEDWWIKLENDTVRYALYELLETDRITKRATRNTASGRGSASGRAAATRTATSRPSEGVSGSNHALSANGNTDGFRIRPLDVDVLKIGTTDAITVGARVKLTAKTGSDNHTILASSFDFGDDLGYLFQVDESDGSIHVFYGENTSDSDTGLIPYGEYHWVIFRVSGTTLDVFLDDEVVYTDTITRVGNGTGVGTTDVTYFGEEGAEFRTLRGLVEKVFSVKSALTDQQIANLVAGTFPTVDILYELNENKGTLARDTSGNNNHGAITNAVYSTDVS